MKDKHLKLEEIESGLNLYRILTLTRWIGGSHQGRGEMRGYRSYSDVLVDFIMKDRYKVSGLQKQRPRTWGDGSFTHTRLFRGKSVRNRNMFHRTVECRCDERLKTKVSTTEGSTHLGYTGLRGGLEPLKIETRLTDERFASVMWVLFIMKE
jgi:hypothetical protein